MNKKITLYELLGLVKDGQAPKKIKYDDYIWSWAGDDYCTVLKDDTEQYLITGMYYTWLTEFLSCEVEILNDEEKEIEISDYQYAEIPSYFDLQSAIKTCNENFAGHNKVIRFLLEEVNKLKKEGKQK